MLVYSIPPNGHQITETCWLTIGFGLFFPAFWPVSDSDGGSITYLLAWLEYSHPAKKKFCKEGLYWNDAKMLVCLAFTSDACFAKGVSHGSRFGYVWTVLLRFCWQYLNFCTCSDSWRWTFYTEIILNPCIGWFLLVFLGYIHIFLDSFDLSLWIPGRSHSGLPQSSVRGAQGP